MKKKTFAIVVSRFNSEITQKLLQGTFTRLMETGVQEKNITIINVPGAIEIPLAAQLLAKTKAYHAIICLGAVIRGETSHYDYVCQQVSQGCQKIMLDHDMPVIFGILTVDSIEQALDRVGGKEGHKGKEAADAAITMIEVVHSIKNASVPYQE